MGNVINLPPGVLGGAAVWGAVTGTLSNQTDLNAALALKAPIASPTFTGVVTTPVVKITAAQTTLTATGTAVCSQPEQGSSYKKVCIYLNAYTDAGTQTYTFPTAFTHTPFVYGLTAGVAGATATSSTITFTVTGATGFVFLEGF